MRLGKPLSEELSPVANWLVVLILFLPVGICLAILELAHVGSWQAFLAAGGLAAAGGVSALFWERSRILRCVPILYGMAFGICVKAAHGTLDRPGLLEALAIGLTLGLGMMFSVWIETVSVRGNRNSN